jgi:nitrate reductase gamma subunit
MWDTLLFIIFPYFAVSFAVLVGVYRYIQDKYSYSSFSSQLLENRLLVWGIIVFHYSIISILIAHLWWGWLPDVSIAFVSSSVSLFILEMLGYILGFLAIGGLGILIARRLIDPNVRKVTTFFDWLLLADLGLQLVLGSWIALSHRWGSLWYPATASPWFYSLFLLRPDYSTIVHLPWFVKAHFFNAWILVFLFPLTRLVHFVTVPVTYVWRPFQMVIWHSWKTFRKTF